MLFSALILSTLLSLVAGRPVPSKLGVTMTKVGKLKVAVAGPVLKISPAHCSGRFFIKYPTIDVGSISPGFCGMGDDISGTERASGCALKLDAEELLEIEAVTIPPGCSLKLINAYFPEEDKDESSGVPVVAIIVPCVIVGIILIAVLVTVVVCCYKRRTIRSGVAPIIFASAVQPSPSDSLPTALPSSTLESKISSDKLEASISSVPALKPPKKTTMKKVSSPANNAIDKSKQKIRSNRFLIRSYRDEQPTGNESGIVKSFHYLRTRDSEVL